MTPRASLQVISFGLFNIHRLVSTPVATLICSPVCELKAATIEAMLNDSGHTNKPAILVAILPLAVKFVSYALVAGCSTV